MHGSLHSAVLTHADTNLGHNTPQNLSVSHNKHLSNSLLPSNEERTDNTKYTTDL